MNQELKTLISAAETVCKTLEHPSDSVNSLQMWKLRDALTGIAALSHSQPSSGEAVAFAWYHPEGGRYSISWGEEKPTFPANWYPLYLAPLTAPAADGEVERLREELHEKQKYIDQLECAINVLTK